MIVALRFFALSFVLSTAVCQAQVPPPFVPAEAQVFLDLFERDGLQVVETETPKWAADGMKRALEPLGIDPSNVKTWAVAVEGKPGMVIRVAYDTDGHALGIRGNGPWLTNDTLASFTALPELRSISMDHNGFAGKQPEGDPYDGSGFAALANSKLASIKIGLSFNDAGMAAAAQIPSLTALTVGHSRATSAGIDPFIGNPNIASFSISEMASQRVTEEDLAKIARIPNLKKVGFGECYITYDNGFIHLKPLAGQLEEIDLRMSLFSEEDLARLQADHPNAIITTYTPEQIAKGHIFVARKLVKLAPPEVAAPLQAAIDALPKK